MTDNPKWRVQMMPHDDIVPRWSIHNTVHEAFKAARVYRENLGEVKDAYHHIQVRDPNGNVVWSVLDEEEPEIDTTELQTDQREEPYATVTSIERKGQDWPIESIEITPPKERSFPGFAQGGYITPPERERSEREGPKSENVRDADIEESVDAPPWIAAMLTTQGWVLGPDKLWRTERLEEEFYWWEALWRLNGGDLTTEYDGQDYMIVAGAVSSVFMKLNPDMVMPTEEVIEVVRNVIGLQD